MKLIIEHGNTKREIEGPFNICASREVLEDLARQITRELATRELSYGWIEIRERTQRSITNTKPVPWDAEGGVPCHQQECGNG